MSDLHIAMLPADGDIFAELLRRKFPRIRFLPFDYNSIRGSNGRKRARQQDELAIEYLDSCHHPGHLHVMAWVEPEDWSPIWVGPFDTGYYRLVNKPTMRVVICGIEDGPASATSHYMSAGSIWEWTSECPVRKRFFGQVKRVVTSFCSDWLLHIDPDTGEPKAGLKNFNFWMGPHAADWCRQHPRRHVMRLRPPPPGSPPDPRKTTGKPLRP